MIVLTLVIFLVVRVAVQNFRVSGTSMVPTVHNGDLVLVNELDYLLSSPHDGDVIVFRAPSKALTYGETHEDYIKRVIGTPGDTVEVKANQGVWVDGKKLSEPYIAQIPNYNYGPKHESLQETILS